MDTPKPGEKINIELMYIYQWLDTLTLSHPKKKYIKRFFRRSIISRSNKTLLSKNSRFKYLFTSSNNKSKML